MKPYNSGLDEDEADEIDRILSEPCHRAECIHYRLLEDKTETCALVLECKFKSKEKRHKLRFADRVRGGKVRALSAQMKKDIFKNSKLPFGGPQK